MDLAIDDANKGHLTEFRFKCLGPRLFQDVYGCLEKGTKPNKNLPEMISFTGMRHIHSTDLQKLWHALLVQ